MWSSYSWRGLRCHWLSICRWWDVDCEWLKGKEYCVILDNVGLYKRFGLPSVDRDWQSMFEGRTSLEDILQEACMQVNSHNCRMDLMMDGDEEMMKIINHECQQQMIMDTYGYQIVEDEKV